MLEKLAELNLLIKQLQETTKTKVSCNIFKTPNQLNKIVNVTSLVSSIYEVVLNDENPKCLGVELKPKDIERLINLHLSDLYKYATKEDIHLNGKLSYGHEYFSNGALFYLAKKTLIPSSFENLRECESTGFDFYQIPFILRLAIENKAKSIIGYKSSRYVRNDRLCLFPTSKVIQFLINDENCMLHGDKELLNVYKWSCTFVHEAKIDYIWNIMNAVRVCNPIFDNLYNQKLRGRIKSESDIMEELNNLHKINFFKSDLDINLLQNRINNSQQFVNKISFELSLEEVESSNVIYSS